jgi:N-methylhydantoinase A/oxoprolinase/acetone carboxylase beta subunit
MIIGLDVGGTHTDAVLIGKEGLIHSVKVPTDPDHLLPTIISALGRLTENQVIADIERLVLSTTLATNLVIQKKLPPVAVLVSAGPGIDPEYFRIGDHYHIVQGVLDHSGREITSIDKKQIIDIGKQLKDQGITCAAVVSKFSVRNPAHELQIAELLSPYIQHVFMGHALSGTLNFPRRITTTYLNAAVYPIHCTFFDAVQLSLEKQGLSLPIRVLKPDGGSMNFSSSLDYPAQTILSGPSASVMGAISSAPKDKTCLVLDIGGTTTDMALILNGVPVIAKEGIEIGSYKTLIRALMTRSIGIGGDSVVRIKNGKLTIGPDRIGVAMAYGGPVSTPTDALCILGLTEGGDVQLANKGLSLLAAEMNMSIEEVSESIIDLACHEILEAADKMVNFLNSRPVYTVHEMFENLQIKPDHILVLGGPATQFTERLARFFTGEVETVPHWGVANAIGCALSRVTCEVTVYADTSQKTITAQGEKFEQKITADITLEDVRQIAFDLVRAKALRRGAIPEYLEMEIIEESEFNMIRDFYTQGKNIRVRAQVKPGLLPNSIRKEAIV